MLKKDSQGKSQYKDTNYYDFDHVDSYILSHLAGTVSVVYI